MKRFSNVFIAWTLQGIAAFVWLALLPTDTEHGLIFGFSASRLALIGATLALTGISGALLWFSHRSDFTFPPQLRNPIYFICILSSICAPAAISILYGLGKTSGYIYTAYAGRLAPLAVWLTLSALELALWLAEPQKAARSTRSLLRTTLIVLLTLACISIFIGTTRLGITRYNDGSWGSPTTSLLEWQILIALTVGLLFPAFEKRWLWLRKEWVMCALIYLSTCALWLSQPINPGFFATAPRSPNFEIYPFSDALIYAQYAQSALIGNGFMWPEVPTRPLYIAFITWLHALAGQDYSMVIALQTLVLAAFPVSLYMLGRELAGRPLGLGLAVLATLRDLTANIAAPFALNYTYTKLFFSEIPTALLLSLFSLVVIRWMKKPGPVWLPLIAGGLLGLSSLIRLQSGVLMAAVLPLSFFVIKPSQKWLVGCALMLSGMALALLPWLARNYAATGGLVLDNPISQTMVLARRWGGDNGNTLIPRLPGEGDARYSSRMSALAFENLRANPARILGSAVNHFFNNEIGNLLVFPLRDALNSPSELIWPEHAFWQNWTGKPTPGQLTLISFYMVLLALGLAAAWHYNGLIGMLPLMISLVYNAWTALFLSSGDRFLVPVDWAIYFYLFLGLLTLANLLSSGIASATQPLPDNLNMYSAKKQPIHQWGMLILTAVTILILGASVPLTELVFARKYSAVHPISAKSGEISVSGRAVYPRWYEAGEGEPGSAKMGYGVSDQARLVFFLIGEENTLVIFPRTSAPMFFPNAVDVTISAKQETGYLLATKIIVRQNGKLVEYLP